MQRGERQIGVTRGERRFVAGDPLRALAALSVLAMHCSLLVAARHNGIANAEIAFGQTKGRAILALQLGVYVFFTLSGYLLARPFIRSFTHGTAPPATGRYLERRLLRIVPAFWVVCLVMIAIYGSGGSSAGQIVAMFGFAQTYNPGLVDGWMGQAWTLDCEMLFYLLLPLAGLLLAASIGRLPRDRRRLALVTLVLLAIGYVGYQLRGLGVADAQNASAPLGLLRAFLPGIGLAAIEVLAVDKLRGKRWGPWLALACVALGVAALATTLKMRQSSLDIEWAGIAAGGFLVAGALIKEWTTGRSWRVLDNRVLQWLGERSYGIYLIHALVIGKLAALVSVTQGPTANWLKLIVVVTLITVALAAILYRVIEVPAMHVARNGLRRRPRVATEAA